MEHTIDDYVCPECFYPLEECTCEYEPWQLIQIDKGIQSIIRILNEKGYTTNYCCEGHFSETVKGGEIYISFIYPPTIFPDGWTTKVVNKGYRPVTSFYYRIKKNSKLVKKQKEYFEEQKAKALEELLQFVNDLPVNPDF